jgi:hypothetical protein
MTERVGVAAEKWELGRGPITLVGRPPVCRGFVDIVNRSPEKVRVRTILLAGLDFRSVPAPTTARVFVRLDPHERSRTPVQVHVHETVPPGTYTGELFCGSQKEPVVIHVLENESLDINPTSLSISGSSEQRVNLRIFVTNRGNVTYALRETDIVYLEERKEIRRSLTAALRDAGHTGYEKFLDRFVGELAATGVNPAAAKVRSENANIHPGEVREVKIELRLPDNLKKNRLYAGKLTFKNAQLLLEVECIGTTHTEYELPVKKKR